MKHYVFGVKYADNSDTFKHLTNKYFRDSYYLEEIKDSLRLIEKQLSDKKLFTDEDIWKFGNIALNEAKKKKDKNFFGVMAEVSYRSLAGKK